MTPAAHAIGQRLSRLLAAGHPARSRRSVRRPTQSPENGIPSRHGSLKSGAAAADSSETWRTSAMGPRRGRHALASGPGPLDQRLQRVPETERSEARRELLPGRRSAVPPGRPAEAISPPRGGPMLAKVREGDRARASTGWQRGSPAGQTRGSRGFSDRSSTGAAASNAGATPTRLLSGSRW